MAQVTPVAARSTGRIGRSDGMMVDVSDPATDADVRPERRTDEPPEESSGAAVEQTELRPRDIDTRRWWKGDRSVLIVTGIVALGFVLMIRGVLSGVTGDDRAPLPDAIESVNPVPDAVQVLNQTSVFVDLAPGYTGEFVIDGIAIDTVNVDEVGGIEVEPGQQLDLPPVTIYEPGNATLTFTPSSSAPIAEFTEGEHRVILRYWLIEDGPARSTTFRWTFSTF